jgi:hypothetical protein
LLTDQEMSRQEVRDLCLRTLVNALGTDLDLTRRPNTSDGATATPARDSVDRDQGNREQT